MRKKIRSDFKSCSSTLTHEMFVFLKKKTLFNQSNFIREKYYTKYWTLNGLKSSHFEGERTKKEKIKIERKEKRGIERKGRKVDIFLVCVFFKRKE